MKVIIICNLILFGQNLIAQSDSLKNKIYLDIGGPGAYYSINYGRDYKLKNNIGLETDFGFSKMRYTGFINHITYYFPFRIKIYHSNKKNRISAGPAITFYKWKYKTSGSSSLHSAIFLEVGYLRYFNEHFFIGASICPELFEDGELRLMPWGALKIGCSF